MADPLIPTRDITRRDDGLIVITLGTDCAIVGDVVRLSAYVLAAFEDREAAHAMRSTYEGKGPAPMYAYVIALSGNGGELFAVAAKHLGVSTAYTSVRTLEQREVARRFGFDRVPGMMALFAR